MTPDNDSPVEGPTPQLLGLPGEPLAKLPARRRRTRPSGRHRGAESFAVPSDAPALVLAIPGTAGPDPAQTRHGHATAQTIAELAALTEAGHPGLSVRTTWLPGLADQLRRFTTGPGGEPGPGAVVVPLIAGPLPAFEEPVRATVNSIRASVAGSGTVITVGDPLGPHPLIAQALHTRLTEAGLAREDRVRLLTMVTAADGIIVAVAGGAMGIREAEVTCVLLASRLAIPIVPFAIEDGPAGVAAAAERLRRGGAIRIAISPCVIGPELRVEVNELAAAEPKIEVAAPLGAHPALAGLIAERYATALERAWAELDPS